MKFALICMSSVDFLGKRSSSGHRISVEYRCICSSMVYSTSTWKMEIYRACFSHRVHNIARAYVHCRHPRRINDFDEYNNNLFFLLDVFLCIIRRNFIRTSVV